jgi:hypothetical protein
MKRVLGILVSFLLFTSIFSSTAQEVKVKASMDTSSILIGQQVDLKLSVNIAAGKKLVWPLIGDSIAPGVEVVNKSKIDSVFSADKKNLDLLMRLRITSFDSGIHVLPLIPFYDNDSRDSASIIARTESLMLNVQTVMVDTNRAFKDIKGPLGIPITFKEMLPWILGGIGILAVIGLVVYYFIRRKKNKPILFFAPKPELPPHVAALEDLEKLRVAKLWQMGRIKEYHTALTDILRIYIERRYQVMAMEMTSDEIVSALKYSKLPKEANAALNDILSLSDLVKFAKATPLPDEHETSLRKSIEFVNLTTAES